MKRQYFITPLISLEIGYCSDYGSIFNLVFWKREDRTVETIVELDILFFYIAVYVHEWVDVSKNERG